MNAILAALLLASTPDIPGAVQVEQVKHKAFLAAVAQSPSSRAPSTTLVSDDGRAVFLYNSRYRRFLLDADKPAPEEDLFIGRVGNAVRSYTTSQYSYAPKQLTDRARQIGSPRMVAAPSKDALVVGISTRGALWIVSVQWEARSSHPNKETVISETSGMQLRLLSARPVSGGIESYVERARMGETGQVLRVSPTGSRTVVGTCPGNGFDDYDVGAKMLLAFGSWSGSASIAGIGASSRTSFELPGKPKAGYVREAFFFKGVVYATADKVYKLTPGGEWREFGSGYRLLAKSANDRWWIVVDSLGRIWQAKF